MVFSKNQKKASVMVFKTKLKVMMVLEIYPELKRFLIRIEVLCRILGALYRDVRSWDEMAYFILQETRKLKVQYENRINNISYPKGIRKQFNQYCCILVNRLSYLYQYDRNLFSMIDSDGLEDSMKNLKLILCELGNFVLN